MENIIEIENLTYKNIFNKFNISIPKNKFVTIAGPNNCGKTTLIRLLDKEIDSDNSITVDNIKLEDIKTNLYHNYIFTIIPNEYYNEYETVQEELNSVRYEYEYKKEDLKELIKKFKVTRLLKKTFNELEIDEKLKIQIIISLMIKPKVILFDNLDYYLSKQELNDLLELLNVYKKELDLTVVFTLNNLDFSLKTDYIYIISNSKIVVEGTPLDVLSKDNIINKAGLNIPFMVDLSVKLKDYDLIDEVILDKEKMVDKLWK